MEQIIETKDDWRNYPSIGDIHPAWMDADDEDYGEIEVVNIDMSRLNIINI